jgi:hypothetical protein
MLRAARISTFSSSAPACPESEQPVVWFKSIHERPSILEARNAIGGAWDLFR